jgi:hypothetical protein
MKITPETTIFVEQRQIALTEPTNGFQILATLNLITCIGVALHKPETGETLLTHIGSLTNKKSLEYYFELFALDGKKINAHIIGGFIKDEYNTQKHTEVLEILSKCANISIVTNQFPSNIVN